MIVSTIRHLKSGFPISLLLLAALGLAGVAIAGTVPAVTNFNVVSNGATSWVINGVNNPSLTLVRGGSYQFSLQNVAASHPFFINTINTTGTANQYTTGVTGNGGTGNTVIAFMVPISAPNSLFYNCGNHGSMNGTLTIVNDGIFASGFDQ